MSKKEIAIHVVLSLLWLPQVFCLFVWIWIGFDLFGGDEGRKALAWMTGISGAGLHFIYFMAKKLEIV